MNYIGVDFHKSTSYITRIDGKGKLISQSQIFNTPEAINSWAKTLEPGDRVAVEAVGHWMYLYEQLEDSPCEFFLSHPQATKAIAHARLKNDRVDSEMLAQLLRTGLLPEAYVPSREIRDLRELLRLRAFLVRMRTRVKNRIRSVLLKTGNTYDHTDILGKGGILFCQGLEVRESYRRVLNHLAALGRHYNSQINALEKVLEKISNETPHARLLMTMPGIGIYSALLILSEIGEIERFRKADQLVSWAGLAPKNDRSANKIYRGPISKRGSKYVRWVLIEDAHHAIRLSKRFKSKYDSVFKSRGRNKAKTAVAASMLRSIHWMLTHDEPFCDID